jgi:hypothetical protein
MGGAVPSWTTSGCQTVAERARHDSAGSPAVALHGMRSESLTARPEHLRADRVAKGVPNLVELTRPRPRCLIELWRSQAN